ncbi:hypothetical protein KDL29_03550 [bacterium]|nr:hypothetical protein [bacterium]
MSEKGSQAGKGSGLLLQLLVTAVGAWAAYSYLGQDRSPAPCGTPLPDIPQVVTDIGDDTEGMSIRQGLIPTNYLDFMAPQPDGTMPLRYPLDVYRCDFDLKLPMGTTSLPMGDSFYEDAVDSQVVFQYEQQLDYMKISLPMRQEGESVTEFVARARSDYEGIGATFKGGTDPLKFDGMIFQHFEFERETQYEKDGPSRNISHYVYFGPAGNRVLVIDFLTTPDRHAEAKPLVEKIMRSISPGNRFLEQMAIEYPELAEGGSAEDETGSVDSQALASDHQ